MDREVELGLIRKALVFEMVEATQAVGSQQHSINVYMNSETIASHRTQIENLGELYKDLIAVNGEMDSK
jgi:hypothetical protein